MAEDDGQKDDAENVVEVDANGNTIEVPPNSPKKRKLTSKVWTEFDKMKGRDGSESAKCKHCRKVFVSGADKGTSHLRNHLLRCNRRNKRTVDQMMVVAAKNASDLNSRIENFKFDQERSRMDFAKMIIKHNYPFSMSEHEYFEILLNGLQPMFKLVSRNTVSAIFDLFTEYEDDLSQSKTELRHEVGGSYNDNMVASNDDELSGFDSWYVRGRSSNIIAHKKSELE
ncbi:hypothetical protein M0R45_017251 [Rubus argutus]|uniref:BED-type domain-containing protein n=1 Tax=Rubus argutus TaxID=59490 RepID=A0AAW1XV67_RUBAR